MIKAIGKAYLYKEKVGGKAFYLNDLKQRGFPVPDGIIVEDDYFKSSDKEEISTFIDKQKLYAVRSSALDEDGSKYSFAGLQDTYLNVTYDQVVEKVESCYQSQFNERATEYRKNFGIEASKGMTVVVQEMVNADYAGVIFTQNPQNNRIDQVVIEVIAGLGEDLVSGYLTPTTYTVNRNIPDKYDVKGECILTTDLIKELIDYAKKIEDVYEVPQDIEFAIRDNVIYILQARPITTIILVPKTNRDGLRFFLSFAHIQNMTYPMTPAGADMIQSIFFVEKQPFFHNRMLYNGEYMFIDITELLLTPNFIFKNVINILSNINFDLPELAKIYREKNKSRKMLPFSLIKLQMMTAFRIMRIVKKNAQPTNSVGDYMEDHLERFKGYSEEELLNLRNESIIPVFINCLPYILAGIIGFFRLKRLFEKWQLDMEDYKKLISGLEGNITTEMGLLYDDMLLHYGTDQGEKIIENYLDKFGMRVDGEIDLGRPRPKDDIESFRKQIAESSKYHNGTSLRVQHSIRVKEADEVVNRLRSILSRSKFNKLYHQVKLVRNFYIYREHPKYTVMRIFELYRNLLNSPYESLSDQIVGECNEEVIASRKAKYELAMGKNIPLAMLSNGLILNPTSKIKEGYIQGFGVSSGIVTATVRVIEHMNDDVLLEGEILVTKFTDPGWTPVLAKAGGIITEVGGMMTHGAIVSREYGIPAVVGVPDVIDHFKTGDLITLNGDTGQIVKEV